MTNHFSLLQDTSPYWLKFDGNQISITWKVSVMSWKYLAAWFVMLLVSIANGATRDFTYGRHMSELAAHQLSTFTSVLLLGVVIWLFVRFFPPSSAQHAIYVGLAWVVLTVAFEFLFFHFVGGHSWSELFANYNIFKGRVWVIVLLWIAAAPYVFFQFRNLLKPGDQPRSSSSL